MARTDEYMGRIDIPSSNTSWWGMETLMGILPPHGARYMPPRKIVLREAQNLVTEQTMGISPIKRLLYRTSLNNYRWGPIASATTPMGYLALPWGRGVPTFRMLLMMVTVINLVRNIYETHYSGDSCGSVIKIPPISRGLM